MSKWKNRQRRSEIRTRQAGSRHGFPSEAEEILSVFKDLNAEEKAAIEIEKVISAMKSKGYTANFASSYLKDEESSPVAMSLEQLRKMLESKPLPMMEVEFARMRRSFDAFESSSGDSLGPEDIPKFIEEAQKSSRLFRNDIPAAVQASRREGDRLQFAEFSSFLLEKATRTAYTAEEEASLVRTFQEFDRDGNGYLTLEEVVEVMERRGYPSIFARVFMDALDSDGDFMITLEEYKQKLASKPIPVLDSGLAELKRLFSVLDKNGDGVVDADDLKEYIEEAESASRFFGLAIRDAITVIDKNKDGKISFEELTAFIKQKAPIAPVDEEEFLIARFRDLLGEREGLSSQDVVNFMHKDGYQPMFVRKFLEAIDVNQDKNISVEEFVQRLRSNPIPLEEAHLANLSRTFEEVDKQGSGFVQLEQLTAYLEQPDAALQPWFRRALQSVAAKLQTGSARGAAFRELAAGLRLEAQNRLFA